ncbi:MAG: Asp-tRNA(Asn)/Glu-tRNA(Gln) amidotransferase subunit GatA [Candidatus Eisenbacteria bacterium]|nr:Asp-tRNA(Asn)/Glu-tRNA(Gln) amidotransferase subunit GatA [Candidatus Eisenbacteria bacterium]
MTFPRTAPTAGRCAPPPRASRAITSWCPRCFRRARGGRAVSDRGPSIAEHVTAVRARRVRIPDLVSDSLQRISMRNRTLGAFLHVLDEEARARAEALQSRLERGAWPGPLTGVPIAIKDNLCLRGVPTTAASRLLAGYRPPYTATAVARLLDAGAVIVGKTNLDEFAMGSSSEQGAFGPVRNPLDPQRVAGGSSGGSAAAVAAGMALGALGSDTGGSVRQPAAFCGLVGLKPHYGTVSRYGLIAFASSLDIIGPLARSVDDCARLWRVIAGRDRWDATSRDAEDRDPEGGRSLAELRLGVPRDWVGGRIEAPVREAFERFCAHLAARGAELVPVTLPDTEAGLACYHLLADAEAASNLARYDGVRYGSRAPEAGTLAALYRRTRGRGFGGEVRRRILLGTYVLRAGAYDRYYRRALRARDAIRAAFDQVLAGLDAVLTPMTPTRPFRLGTHLRDPLRMYASDRFAVMPNLTGWPALTFPITKPEARLPIGGQLCGGPHSEVRLLRLAAMLQGGGAA